MRSPIILFVQDRVDTGSGRKGEKLDSPKRKYLVAIIGPDEEAGAKTEDDDNMTRRVIKGSS
jgi:hypothetical protein